MFFSLCVEIVPDKSAKIKGLGDKMRRAFPANAA